ncbi:hypothetical protein Tcan_00145 [Toxocara canis]|uniref:Uncharacterized protein n=1 Tax=Toxocara canis TaxID=6265 RepID=A0A0B2W498_TOXCA|nr:hypothetical protein Tcan_00145 [Toxocara canis]
MDTSTHQSLNVCCTQCGGVELLIIQPSKEHFQQRLDHLKYQYMFLKLASCTRNRSIRKAKLQRRISSQLHGAYQANKANYSRMVNWFSLVAFVVLLLGRA